MSHMNAMGAIGKDPVAGISRVAYTDADKQGREFAMRLMRDAGFTPSIDAAGNISARRPGSDPHLAELAASPFCWPSACLHRRTPASAHDIPADSTVRMFVKPDGPRLHVLVRVQMASINDVDWPLRRPTGYLDLARVEPFSARRQHDVDRRLHGRV